MQEQSTRDIRCAYNILVLADDFSAEQIEPARPKQLQVQ